MSISEFREGVIDMCPIFKAGDLPSVVDESVFLKEVDVALHGIRAEPVPPGASVADAARWCLRQLSGAVLADRRRQLAGAGGDPPMTGAFAPVDLEAIQADPACTAEYFGGVLRAWGIGPGGSAGLEQGIADVARRLDLTAGEVHGVHGRAPVAGVPMAWRLEYVPFSLLSGEVGLLFAFTAVHAGQDRPRR